MAVIKQGLFPELAVWRRGTDRLFDEALTASHDGASAARLLPMDAYETDDALVIEATVPGIRPEDVDITLERGRLTIKTHRPKEEDEGRRWLHRETWRGHYVRHFTLPESLLEDKAEARYDHGMLTLRIPKKEAAKPRQIKVQAK